MHRVTQQTRSRVSVCDAGAGDSGDSVIGNCGDLRGSSDYRLGFYKTLKVSWKIHVMGLEHIFTARNKWIPQTRIGQTTLLCR